MHKSVRRRINPNWQYIPRLYEISANDLNTMAFSSLWAKWILWKTCTQFVFTVYKRLTFPDACECWVKAGWSYAPKAVPTWINKMFPWSEVNFLPMLVCFWAESLIKSLLHTKSVLSKCSSNLIEARVSISSQAWCQGHNLKPSPQL